MFEFPLLRLTSPLPTLVISAAVDDKHHFKDAELSYRFLFDNDKETAKKKQEFYCSESFTRRTVHLMGGPNVGIVLKPASNKIESVVEGSNAQVRNVGFYKNSLICTLSKTLSGRWSMMLHLSWHNGVDCLQQNVLCYSRVVHATT